MSAISGFSPSEADIVIMGGGPVGLDAAIKIRKRTGKNVVVLEKYDTYQRTNISLRLAKDALKGLSQIDDEMKAKTREWTARRVPISEIENELTRKAHELGVQIIKPHEVDPLQLGTHYPHAQVFIGADGARSSFRKELLSNEGKEFAFNQTHQYVINVHYRVTLPEGDEDAKSRPFEAYRKLKLANYYVSEHRTKIDNDDIAVSMQIFVDESTYNSMTPATFKNPYYFDETLCSLPQELRDVLIKWWGYEKGEINQLDHQKNRINVIKLGSYRAENLYRLEGEKVKVLAGDAAAGFPFFVAINNGFRCSTELADRIEEGFQRKSFAAPMKAFARYAARRAFIERIKATFKSFYINFTHIWIRSSNNVPWSSVKVGRREKQKAIVRGTEIMERLMKIPSPSAAPAPPPSSSLIERIIPADMPPAFAMA